MIHSVSGLSVCALLAAVALAQPTPATDAAPKENPYTIQPTKDASELAQAALDAYGSRNWEEANRLLRAQIAIQPSNFVPYYNLACCLAHQNKPDEAVEFLLDAVDRGFSDVHQIRRDDSLAPLRNLEKYKDLLKFWPAVLEKRRDANMEGIKRLFQQGYSQATDQRARVVYHSAFDARAFDLARKELALVCDWAESSVMPDIFDEAFSPEDAWVMIVLPTRTDFGRWAAATYGESAIRGTSMIGGSYEHDTKRLVAMDLGATLRHEFMHVLHWRHCTRLGQRHPIWIMEGLCSLPEDYELDSEGRFVPATSWRTNMVQRIEKTGGLMPIEKLAALSQARFTGTRPLAMYAQARAIFLYIAQSNKLREWYADYTANYKDDTTGVKSIERVFGKPIAEINRDFRVWIRALPPVAEQIKIGMASLGIDVDSGNGEGPIVAAIDLDRKDKLGGLKVGDVMTTIDDKPIRDIAELVRVLGGYAPGQTVEVAYRRGKLYNTASITLVAHR